MNRIFALVASFCVFGITGTADAVTSLVVKNFSNRNVYVAISHHVGGGVSYRDFHTQGWWKLRPNEIKRIHLSRDIGHLHISANYEGGQPVIFFNATNSTNKYYSNKRFSYTKRIHHNGITTYNAGWGWTPFLPWRTRLFYGVKTQKGHGHKIINIR